MKQFLIPVNEINSLTSKTLSETRKPSVKGNHSLKPYCCIIGSTNPCRITRKVEQTKYVLCTLKNLF